MLKNVMKYIVAIYLQISTSFAKNRKPFYFLVCPRVKRFSKRHGMFKLNAIFEFRQALQKIFAILLFFSLITDFPESYLMFRHNNCKCL